MAPRRLLGRRRILQGWPLLAAGLAAGLLGASRAAVALPLRVALTREAGQNGKLRKALAEAFVSSKVDAGAVDLVEVPLIEHGTGPGFEAFEARLRGLAEAGRAGAAAPPLDAVVLTSPEAARVFLKAWSAASAGAPLPVPVATVGKGTSAVVRAGGLDVAFEPTIANAETLAVEMPADLGPRVMYPSSAIAPGTLAKGLEKRGFEVERHDTYTTQPVEEHSAETLALMGGTAVVTFGSPSAVRSWAKHTPSRPIAACIGGSSEEAAKKLGFPRILAPEKPGVQGWAEVSAAAVRELLDGQA